MKNFIDLTDPGRAFNKGITLQGMHLPSVLPVIGQSWLRRRGYVTGAAVHVPRQRNSTYVQTVIQYIYETR